MSVSTIEEIDILIKKYHNPSLINTEESPNANRIYHIYSNGQITNQKGSYAYLHRNEFVDYNIINNKLPLLVTFPIKNDNEYYAIVEKKHAIEIRNLMLKIN